MSQGGAVKSDEKKDIKPKKDSGSGRHRRTEVQVHDDPMAVVVAGQEGSGAHPLDAVQPPAAAPSLLPANDADKAVGELGDAIRRLSLEDNGKAPAVAAPPVGKKDKQDRLDDSSETEAGAAPIHDPHHRRTEVQVRLGKVDETINHEELVRLYRETMALVKEQDDTLTQEYKQTVQIGRIHDNVDHTAIQMHEAHQDINATASCCDGLMQQLAKYLCCCCTSAPPAPHHAQDVVEQFPPPVVFAPGNPQSDKEMIAELARADRHLREAGDYEQRLIRYGNQDLTVTVDAAHQADDEVKKTDGKANSILKK